MIIIIIFFFSNEIAGIELNGVEAPVDIKLSQSPHIKLKVSKFYIKVKNQNWGFL